MMRLTIAVLLLITGAAVLADDLTIPNTFQPNTPARASEVNANFSAVEASVDDNALQVTTTAEAVNILTSNVQANSDNISAVTQAVSALSGPPPYKFVGFSSGTSNGGGGAWGLLALCQSDFGPNARMASSQEVSEAAVSPTLNSAGAWVRSVIVAAASLGSASGTRVWDYSGYSSTNPDLHCEGWTNTNGALRGLAVLPNGSIRPRGCDESLPVACSIPQ